MSEKVYSLRINTPELETWIDENIQKGELNSLMNTLLLKYQKEQIQEYIEIEQEEKAETNSYIFQMIMFMSIGAWMLVFALSQFIDVLSIVATILLIVSGILLCFYVLMKGVYKTKKAAEVLS